MTISIVQETSVNHAYSGSLGVAATTGNSLLQLVAGDNNSSATSSAPLYNGSSVTGTAKAFERTGTGNGLMYASMWLMPNLPSSGTSFAVTCSANSINGSLTAVEVAGLGTSPSIQGTPVTGDGVTSASVGPTVALGSAPALVAFFGSAFFGWTSTDAGYTTFLTTSNNGCWAYQLPVSSGSTYSWSGAVNSGDGWSAGIALIIPGSGGSSANAGDATGTGAADDATAGIGASAGDAAGTGAALAAAPGVSPVAGDATGTGTAQAATAAVAPGAGSASGSGSALAASVAVSPPAGLGAGTGAALAPVPGISIPGGVAGGDGAALGASAASSGTSASAGLAAGSGTALDASARVPAVVSTGSWWGLVSVLRQADQEFDAYRSMVPLACPQCGQPLSPPPNTPAGATTERYCAYDGWRYPRDYVAPVRTVRS